MSMLKRVAQVSKQWVRKGHCKGQNTHNVSATVSIRESEWADVGEWMWENRDVYNGLSVLDYDGGNYDQAPFEDCSKETYEAMLKSLTDIDLTNVYEADDNTNLTDQAACAGGACEVV